MDLCTKTQHTFVTTGFVDWKRAIEKFEDHEKCATHRHAMMQIQQTNAAPPVNAQLSTQKAADQAAARVALVKLLSSVRFLARQGLALRGHDEAEGNLMQLLQLWSEDVRSLQSWCSRTTSFLSPDSQNEILQMIEMMSHSVLRRITDTIKSTSVQFAVVVDGMQDCSGDEQESVCIRHVDAELNVRETFMGFITPPDTTAQSLANAITDVLLRLTLPVANLRAQTYDGAANMSGAYGGCQALIRHDNPLALFFHCSAHCANLVAEFTSESTVLVRDALQLVNELGVLYKRSGKYRNTFDIAANAYDSPRSLKPVCPTRWLCRVQSVTAVLDQYAAVLDSLEEIKITATGEMATKASALLERFSNGKAVLGLKISRVVFGPLEELNRSLQASSYTISGMLQAVNAVKSQLLLQCTEQQFDELYSSVTLMCEEHGLDAITLPRRRRPPSRFTGNADAHQSATPQAHYRSAFFAVIDSAVTQLCDRFDKEKPGLKTYLSLENMLLTGTIDEQLCSTYPELASTNIAVQLPMFRNSYTFDTVSDCQKLLQKMVPEVRSLFPAVEVLVRLLLICPVSSCAAERSVSALHRLKNWLRSTMTQQRLNAVSVCHVNKDILDKLDLTELAVDFVRRSTIRENIFGRFQ